MRPSRAAGRVPLKGLHFASSVTRTHGEDATGDRGGPEFDFHPYEYGMQGFLAEVKPSTAPSATMSPSRVSGSVASVTRIGGNDVPQVLNGNRRLSPVNHRMTVGAQGMQVRQLHTVAGER
jgi:hypothetical protein